MVGYRPSDSLFGALGATAKASTVDSRGYPLARPVLSRRSFAAVDALLASAPAEGQRHAKLRHTMDALMDELTDGEALGALQVLQRYIWCYATVYAAGGEPTSDQLRQLSDIAFDVFDQIVNAPQGLLPFGKWC